MLNVVICEDVKSDLEKVCRIINKYMIKNGINYERHLFSDYDNNFIKMIKSNLENKIYILDIETPSRSGIDIAREIRKKDSYSPIIFLTGHAELGMDVLKEDIHFTAFINKFVNCESRLNYFLKDALASLNKKIFIKLKDGNTIYNINTEDILYITKDSFERKTIIITDYNEFKVGNSLSSIKEMLNDNFQQTHRACIVNMDRVCKINYSEKEILFDNNDSTYLLSNKYRKEVVK